MISVIIAKENQSKPIENKGGYWFILDAFFI